MLQGGLELCVAGGEGEGVRWNDDINLGESFSWTRAQRVYRNMTGCTGLSSFGGRSNEYH